MWEEGIGYILLDSYNIIYAVERNSSCFSAPWMGRKAIETCHLFVQNSSRTIGANELEKTTISADEYFLSLSDEDRATLETIRDLIVEISPAISQRVWKGIFWGGSEQTILGFGEMTFIKSDKNKDEWFMIGIARQKNQYSLYVSAVKDNRYLVKTYADKLGKTKIGSSSIGFTKLENVNLDNLKKLFFEALTIYNGTENEEM